MERQLLDIKIGGRLHAGRKTIPQTHSKVGASDESAVVNTRTASESDPIDR